MKKFRLLFSMLAATAVMFTACQPGAETPEDPNPDQGTETPENPGGETPENPGGETPTPETPATPALLEFYADATMGQGELMSSMNLTNAIGCPGHWLTLNGVNMADGTAIVAQLVLLDYTVDAMNYVYLNLGDYPVVAGSVDMGNIPTSNCLMADPGFTNFYVEANGTTYYPYVPETAEDADGMTYGVTIMVNPSVTGKDLNLLMFNLPVVDDAGNKTVIQGSYTGPLGFQTDGGGASQTAPFDLNEFGFSNFEAIYNASANMLSLAGQGMMGNFRFNFNLSETDGVWVGQAFDCVEGGGALTGFYWDAQTDVDYTIDSGRVVVEATETPGEYLLVVSSRNPVVLWSRALTYEMAGEFTVKVTGLPDNLK